TLPPASRLTPAGPPRARESRPYPLRTLVTKLPCWPRTRPAVVAPAAPGAGNTSTREFSASATHRCPDGSAARRSGFQTVVAVGVTEPWLLELAAPSGCPYTTAAFCVAGCVSAAGKSSRRL